MMKIWYVYPPTGPRVMVSGTSIEAIPDGRLEVLDDDVVVTRFEREGWRKVTLEKLQMVNTEYALFANKIFPAEVV